jgi:hypothetical protein
MDETTIPSAPEGAAPVEPVSLSRDEGASAIEKILSGGAPSKEDNAAEGEAQTSTKASDEEDEPLVIAEDDDDAGETAQTPAQPQEPGDDTLVTLSNGQKISLGELKKDPFLRRDYTFKLEGLKKQANDFTAWQQAEVQRIQAYRDQVLSYARQRMPQPPDRSMADPNSPNYDPFTYQAEQVRYDNEVAELTAIERGKLAEQQAEQERQEAQAAQNRVQELERFYLALPKLRDETKRNAFFQDVRTIVPQVYNLNAEEILALENSGAMRMVHDAIKYQKALRAGKKVAEELPGKPKLEGRQRSSPAADQSRDMQGRFKALRENNGSFDAAQKAIEAILSR